MRQVTGATLTNKKELFWKGIYRNDGRNLMINEEPTKKV